MRVAFIGEQQSLVDLTAHFAYFCVFSFGRFAYRLHVFGHNLDPRAPFPIEPFTPALLGSKQIANFTTTSFPELGSVWIGVFPVGLLDALFWNLRADSGTSVEARVRADSGRLAPMAVTLLTGASSGIGRSLARRLAARGDAVAAVARRAELLDSLVKEIEDAGGRALAIPCDVTRREQLREATARAESELGPIERLVANAGGGEPTDTLRFDAERVEAIVRLNLLGTVYSIEAVLPGMLARRAGHLVAVSSLASYRGLPAAAGYSAAKAGLSNLVESLRIDLRPRGIDVTLLLPGFVKTSPGPRKRKNSKPFRLGLEAATARMERAILARRPRYAFPWPMVLAVSLGRLLPAPLYDRLLAGRGRAPRADPETR